MRDRLQGTALHREVGRIVAGHVDPRTHRAWLVGPEASGRALPGSDVDIALEGPGRLDLAQLARLRAALDMLPTLRGFDVVDLRRASDRFRRTALERAIPLDLDGDA